MIVFVVVLINILQPISTLFPYTTLFRSQNTTALGVSSLGVPKQPAKLRTFPAEPCGQPAKGNCGSHRSMDGGDFRSPAGALADRAPRGRTCRDGVRRRSARGRRPFCVR